MARRHHYKRRKGNAYGFYGDVPLCWARARNGAWFEDLASSAAFYCAINQSDADEASTVFPQALRIGTGNPLREEMAFPNFTKEQIRTLLDINQNEFLVLAPGGKFGGGNLASWIIIMEALALLTEQGHHFQLVLALHPGDRTQYAVDRETGKLMKLYDEIVSLSPVPTRLVNRDFLPTSDIVPGSDIIIEFGSSIGIEGAFQGVPVISLGLEVLFRRIEGASASRKLESVVNGLSELVVADSSLLANAIQRLLTPDGYLPMRMQQQKLCPVPHERGAALKNIVSVIMQCMQM